MPSFSINSSSIATSQVSGSITSMVGGSEYYNSESHEYTSIRSVTTTGSITAKRTAWIGIRTTAESTRLGSYDITISADGMSISTTSTPNLSNLYKSISDVRPHGIFVKRFIKVF